MELLSTVYWIVKNDTVSPDDRTGILKKIETWNKRKKDIMKPEHVQIAIKEVTAGEWI